MSSKTPSEIIEALEGLLGHLQLSQTMAGIDHPGCRLRLAVAAYNADNSGKIISSFEIEPFMEDIRDLLRIASADVENETTGDHEAPSEGLK